MNTDKKSIWGSIGEIFQDIQRIGTGLAIVGLIADFTASAAVAVLFDVIHAHSVVSLGKEVLGTPALLRDIAGVFLGTLPLTVAITLIAARPKEFLTPLPFGAAWALVLAVILGDVLHLGINLTGYRIDSSPSPGGIGFLLTLIQGFVGQYGVILFAKSCVIGVIIGNRLRHLGAGPAERG
jgi:hypothetical protein